MLLIYSNLKKMFCRKYFLVMHNLKTNFDKIFNIQNHFFKTQLMLIATFAFIPKFLKCLTVK